MAYYSRSITIDHTKCGSSNSTNFPVLVKLSHSTLKTIANGGKVQNSSGYDVVFSSDSAGASLYSWEMVKYDGTNGTIEAWVNIPTVSSSSDTVFYITYGKWASSYSFQGGSSGAAWNSAYKHVVHTGDGTTLDLNDKTTNGTNGTNSSGTATTGQIGGGFAVTAGSRYTTVGNIASIIGSASVHTIEGWVRFTTQSATNYIWDLDAANSLGAFCNLTATTHEWGYGGSYRSYTGISTTTGTWYYCAWVKTGSGDSGKFYINGTEQTSYTGSLGNPNTAASTGGQFGNYHSSGVLCLDGKWDEIRISNVARSADWITTCYQNQNNSGDVGSAGFYTVGSEVTISENCYWVGGTATWNGTAGSKWSRTSGGSSGAPIPSITGLDHVFFDGNSGSGTVTIDDVGCLNFNATGFTGTFASSGSNIVILGDFILGSGCTWSVTMNTVLSSYSGHLSNTINTNGVSVASSYFSVGGTGGTWTFGGNITGAGLNFSTGTFNFSNYNVTGKSLVLGTGTYNMGTGTFTITEDDSYSNPVVNINSGATINASTSTIKFTKTGSGTTTFAGGGKTFSTVWFDRGSSTGSIVITGANTYTVLKDTGTAAHTITFPNSTSTISASGWQINGSSGNVITLQRTGGSGSWTVSVASGTVTADYVSISNSTATGGATFNATNATDGGGNSGWNFVTLVSASVVSATFSIPSYTTSAERFVTVSASVVSATFSVPSYSVSNDALYNATVQTATFTIPTYAAIVPDVTVAATVQTATFSVPAYTVDTTRFVTVSASVASATFSIPTYSAGSDITVSMSTPPSAVFTIPAYTVTGGANVSPSAQSATFSIPSYTPSAERFVTVSATVVSATFTIPSYTITAIQSPTITPSEQILTLSIPTYAVSAERYVTVSVSVVSATFSIPTYAAATSITILPSAQTATFTIPAYTTTAIRNVTISAQVFALIATIPTYRVRGDYWQNNLNPRTKSWSDNVAPATKLWADQDFS